MQIKNYVVINIFLCMVAVDLHVKPPSHPLALPARLSDGYSDRADVGSQAEPIHFTLEEAQTDLCTLNATLTTVLQYIAQLQHVVDENRSVMLELSNRVAVLERQSAGHTDDLTDLRELV